MKRVLFCCFICCWFAVGCSGIDQMNKSAAENGPFLRIIQDETVVALREDIDATTIKITYDTSSSSYLHASNWWYATLPDGREYRCNKLYQKDTICVKRATTKSNTPAVVEKKRRPPHK